MPELFDRFTTPAGRHCECGRELLAVAGTDLTACEHCDATVRCDTSCPYCATLGLTRRADR